MLLGLLVIGAGTALTLWSGIDLAVSGFFYEPGRGFPAAQSALVQGLRLSTRAAAYGVGIFLIAALAFTLVARRPAFGLGRAAVLYLLAAFLLGPGLLVNGFLKEEWGRARPYQIAAFGGTRSFTPALLPANQCERNCSFVSGEASLGFAFTAFGFAALAPRRRRLGIAVGLALGTAFGLLRIAQGGHFLSDVFFAAVVTIGLAWLLAGAMLGRTPAERGS